MDKNRIDSIIFDLDGTLWDTCYSCAEAWNQVLQQNSIPFREITAEDVRKVTGKPHEVCIRETFAGLSEDFLRVLIEQTIVQDNKVVLEKGGFLYPGVGEGLEELSRRFPLFIVSNCQAGYIETFLKWSNYSHLFQDFECWGNTGLSKTENIKRVIERNRLKYPIYVGDTDGDSLAARSCRVPFVFATYGFGTCIDFSWTISSFGDLSKTLIG
jgi:phosphoglycolate phosphatase